jgi:hypothetical protein
VKVNVKESLVNYASVLHASHVSLKVLGRKKKNPAKTAVYAPAKLK